MNNSMPSQTMSAASTLPPQGQQAALRVTELHERLCAGDSRLEDDVWEQLVKAKLPAKTAKMLACKTDTPARLAHLIATERRSNMLAEGLARVPVTDSQLEGLLAGRAAKAVSRALAARWSSHPEERIAKHAAAVATHAGGVYLIEQMACDSVSFDDETAATLLATMTSWAARGGGARARALKGLLAMRPQLVDVFVELGKSETSLMSVVAGSSQLAGRQDLQEQIVEALEASPADFLWATRGFVYNPFVAVEVLQGMKLEQCGYETANGVAWRKKSGRGHVTKHLADVDDADHLEWLIKRSVPGNFRGDPKPGRPFDLIELWKNPNLDDDQRLRVHAGLKSYETWAALDAFGIDSHEIIGEPDQPADDYRWQPDREIERPDLALVGQWPVQRLTRQYHADDAVTWLATKLDSVDQWQLLFVLADDTPDCTLEELAEMVTLVF